MPDATASGFGNTRGVARETSFDRNIVECCLLAKWTKSISSRASTRCRLVQYFTSTFSRLTHSMAERQSAHDLRREGTLTIRDRMSLH